MEYTDFGWALAQLRKGKKVARINWNGKNMYLELQKPVKLYAWLLNNYAKHVANAVVTENNVHFFYFRKHTPIQVLQDDVILPEVYNSEMEEYYEAYNITWK